MGSIDYRVCLLALMSISFSGNGLRAEAPPAPQLLARYAFDRDLSDSAGKPEAQTPSGGVAIQNGAAVFDGTDDLIEVIHNLPETNLSVVLRFKTSQADAGLFAVHTGPLGQTGNDRHMFLREGKPQQRVWNNETISATEPNVADGQWHTWVQVLHPEAGQHLYLDGKLVAKGSKGVSDFGTDQGFLIGYSPDAGHPYFTGEIDELQIWNVALSEQQVARVSQGASPEGGVLLEAVPLPAGLPAIQLTQPQSLPDLPGLAATGASIAYSPNGQQLAVGYFNNAIRHWNLADAKTTDATGHKGGVTALQFSPANDLIATAGMDNAIQIWTNPPAAMPARPLAGHTRWVRDLAFTPDGTRIVSISDDRTVRVWNVADGKVLHTLNGHSDWVVALALRSDGRFAATASYDRTIRVWDIQTGAERTRIESGDQLITDMAWTADGMDLVSVGLDGTIRMWDLRTGTARWSVKGHADQIHTVAIHPGGQWLATAGADRVIQLWQAQQGERVHTLTGPTSWIHGLCWSPDGKKLAAVGVEQIVRQWEFPAP